MNKTINHKFITILLAAVFFCGIISTVNAENKTKTVTIATIWDAEEIPGQDNDLFFEDSLFPIQEERRGFLRGLSDAPGNVIVREKTISENRSISQITTTLADLYTDQDILMTVGASTEAVTMYAAMESNFFEIPMLIPFSDGDLLGSGNNAFVLRMTPGSQSYVDYLQNYIIPKNMKTLLNSYLFGDGPVPDFDIRVGIFFADDFNCHDTAVLLAQTMMDNEINIEVYESYPPEDLESALRNAWRNNESRMRNLDILFILGADQDPMYGLENALQQWAGESYQPSVILIGYAPDNQNDDLWELDNVYILRQSLDFLSCPANIVSYEEAMGYAAGYITKLALSRASQMQPEEPSGWRLWFRSKDRKLQIHQDYLDTFRKNIRTAFLEMKDDIPCFGTLNFNSNMEETVTLELVRYTGPSQFGRVSGSEIFSRIVDRIKSDYGITDIPEL